jgi:hypothetical protein
MGGRGGKEVPLRSCSAAADDDDTFLLLLLVGTI